MLQPAHMIEALSSRFGGLSSKRVFANRICWTFIGAFLAMTGAVCYRIIRFEVAHDLGSGVVAAYAFLTVALAVLGGVIYRKSDGGADAPKG